MAFWPRGSRFTQGSHGPPAYECFLTTRSLCRSCEARTQECGPDNANRPSDGSDCTDLTNKPADILTFNPAGTCFTPETDPTGAMFSDGEMLDPYVRGSFKMSCNDAGTVAYMVSYADGACTDGQQLSGADLDGAFETNVDSYFAETIGNGGFTADITQYEVTEAMSVASSPICSPTLSINCDAVSEGGLS